MQMDSRLDTLLFALSEESFVTLDKLANVLKVSSRTIRTLLRQLEEELDTKGAGIERKRNLGLRLVVKDRKLFQEYLMGKSVAGLPETGDQRVDFLLARFLIESDSYQKIDALCDLLYVSRKTLSGDIKKVEQYLNKYRLQLLRKPHYGLKLAGSEMDIRRCLNRLFQKQDQRWLQEIMDAFRDMEEMKELLIKSTYQCGYTIYEMDLYNILLQIQIALYRLEKGFEVTLDEIGHNELLRENDICVAQVFSGELEAHFGIPISVGEISYIAIQLMGKKKTTENGGTMIIDAEINQLVNEMLESVYLAFCLDLRSDFDLNTLLRRHMVSLRIRLQYQLKLENPILEEIKEIYGFPYAIAAHASTVLAEHFATTVPEEEIGYLALCFALSLKRKEERKYKRNILLICGSGAGSAKLFEYRFREMFGEYLEEIKTGDVNLLRSVDFSRFDYVFSTVPILQPLPIPVCQVKYFFDRHNVDEVEKILKRERTDGIGRYFERRLFFTDVSGEDREEILKAICCKIAEVKELPCEFEDFVLKRESLMQTDFFPYVAIPHPYKPITEETFVSVTILEKPILWHAYEVQMVLLFSVSNKKENLEQLYNTLSKLMSKEKDIKELVQKKDYDYLMDIIRKAEE